MDSFDSLELLDSTDSEDSLCISIDELISSVSVFLYVHAAKLKAVKLKNNNRRDRS